MLKRNSLESSFAEKVSWEDFATIKKWKKQLKIRSGDGELSAATWRLSEYWMSMFLEQTGMNPDALIEEALADNEKGEERLSDLFSWVKEKGLDHNSAVPGVYGSIRGFYSRNKINTQGWTSPKMKPKKVDLSDEKYPMFVKNEKSEKLDLNRILLQPFIRGLNTRDEIIALCLISTGLDDGILLKLTVGFVRDQDISNKRLFLHSSRDKTGEEMKVFFSKEATKKLRKYVLDERFDAADEEPLFTNSLADRKRKFQNLHGRLFSKMDSESLPKGKPLTRNQLATNYRLCAEKLGIKLEKAKQSPLRPKRLRKAFRSACQLAGVGDDVTKLFMGQTSSVSKVYLGKSKEELEYYYDLVEPFVTVYKDEHGTELLEKIQEETNSTVTILKNQIENLQDQLKRKDDVATNAILQLRAEMDEIKKQKS